MNAVRPLSLTLTGRFVQLQPMGSAVLPELQRAIGHAEVFASGFGGGPAALHVDRDGFVAWAHDYFQWESLPYVIRLLGGPNDGDVVGTTTLGDIDVVKETIQLGWTAYDPRVWNSVVSAESQLLALGAAFSNGFRRVDIHPDAADEPPRAAASILAADWPAVRSALQARLDAVEERFVLYRSGRAPDSGGTVIGDEAQGAPL